MPQPAERIHVRVMICGHVAALRSDGGAESLNVTTGAASQLSVAVADPTVRVGIFRVLSSKLPPGQSVLHEKGTARWRNSSTTTNIDLAINAEMEQAGKTFAALGSMHKPRATLVTRCGMVRRLWMTADQRDDAENKSGMARGFVVTGSQMKLEISRSLPNLRHRHRPYWLIRNRMPRAAQVRSCTRQRRRSP